MSWDGYVGQFGKNVYQIFDAKILGNRSWGFASASHELWS